MLEVQTLINFYQKRSNYKKELRAAIKKYGVAKLPDDVKATLPNNLMLLYIEWPWFLSLRVLVRLIQTANLRAKQTAMRRVVNG